MTPKPHVEMCTICFAVQTDIGNRHCDSCAELEQAILNNPQAAARILWEWSRSVERELVNARAQKDAFSRAVSLMQSPGQQP